VKPVIVRAERIVTIPVDVVWQLVEPPRALPAWWPPAQRYLRSSGSGLGRHQRIASRRGPRTAEIDQEIVTYEPNATLAWREVAETVDGRPTRRRASETTVTIRMEPCGPGTRIVLESRQLPASPTAALGLRVFEVRKVRRALVRALDRLAAAGA
jgi:uncharacterized protein YndB with AHSA1/START domain